MTTAPRPALELRLAITDAYSGGDPPPGAERARRVVLALKRAPNDVETQGRARDLLAVVDLRARLLKLRADAERAGAPNLALVAHGLIGHADAELLGATRDPGWRAAALDLLEPDGQERDPLDPGTARRLLALALGLASGAAGERDGSDDASGD